MGVHRKIRFLGWVYEKTTYRGELSKGEGGGGLDSLQFYGGARRKRGGGVFKGGWYPQLTLWLIAAFIFFYGAMA